MNEGFTKPILTEPGVKYFLNETLKQCREFKNNYNNHIFNISLLVIFLIILFPIICLNILFRNTLF